MLIKDSDSAWLFIKKYAFTVNNMLNKNTLGVKKVRGQSEAIMVMSDHKLSYQVRPRS